jgi:uncharacterized protein (DUF2141 family)
MLMVLNKAGETGIGGVYIELYRDYNYNGIIDSNEPIFARATTDLSGHYTFGSLFADQYIVKVVDDFQKLDGLTLTTSNEPHVVSLAAKEIYRNADFGYKPIPKTGSVGDFVWFDEDKDGSQDVGETGISNVVVKLTYAGADGTFGTSDDTLFTQTTDSAGKYQFTALPAGKYSVVVDSASIPSNLSAVSGGQSLGANPYAFSLAQAENRQDLDFAYKSNSSASLGDYVWFDTDKDGVQDVGESGIANVPVKLTFAGADGTFGTGDDVTKTTTTNASGLYQFNDLAAGKYKVEVTQPANTTPTSGAQSVGGNAVEVSLAANQSNQTLDFGYVSNNGASIGDYVWFDVDKDSVQDVGESGIANVPVKLTFAGADGTFGTGDDVTKTTTTDVQGHYQFNDLAAGKYKVEATQPANATSTTGGNAFNVTLAANESNQALDFGYVIDGSASIGDTVFLDSNGDRIQNNGEVGLPSVRINLYGVGADGVIGTADDSLIKSTTTDALGKYKFDGLSGGQYVVKVDSSTLPVGLTVTLDNNLTKIILPTGEYREDLDFGYQGLGKVGDTVWIDSKRRWFSK